MSESQYRSAFEAGYATGFGDGKHEGLKKSRDEFWCGVCVALATWPLAAITWIAWRVF